MKPDVWNWWGYDLMALSCHRLGLHEEALVYGEIALAAAPGDQRLERNLAYYKNA